MNEMWPRDPPFDEVMTRFIFQQAPMIGDLRYVAFSSYNGYGNIFEEENV